MVAPAVIELQRERADAAKAARRRRPARDLEGPVQRGIVRYLRYSLPHGYIVQHTPNGALTGRKGAREKSLGAIAGWPDIAVYGPGLRGPTVWFMEVKPPIKRGEKKRGLHQEQEDCHADLTLAGFSVRVVRSIDDARAAVTDWGLPSLDMSIPDPTGAQL